MTILGNQVPGAMRNRNVASSNYDTDLFTQSEIPQLVAPSHLIIAVRSRQIRRTSSTLWEPKAEGAADPKQP